MKSLLFSTKNRAACRGYFANVLTVLLVCALAACGGGNKQSVLGSPQADPFAFNTAIAYIKRPLPADDEIIDVLDEPLQINPGAHVYMRTSAAAAAEETNISESAWPAGAAYDVRDLNVSPDGDKLVFAMHAPEADVDNPQFTWNIWEYDIATETLTRVIADDLAAEEGDDVQPAYLANGDIIFASTRQDTNQTILLDEGKSSYSGQQEDEARNANAPAHALVLHTLDPEDPGSAHSTIRQITFNQSHDFSPVVLPDGHVLYQRWDNIANNDVVSLYRIHPEGGQMELRYGYHSTETLLGSGSNHLSSMRIGPDDTLIAIAQTNPTAIELLGGDIIKLDIDNYIDLTTPTYANTGLGGSASTSVAPQPIEVLNPSSEHGRFAAVWPLQDGSGRYLTSWASCQVIDPSDSLAKPCALFTTAELATMQSAPPRFQIEMVDPTGNPKTQRPVVLSETGFWYPEVVAAESRLISTPLPETIDTTLQADQRAILEIQSIYDMDGIDITPAGIAALADPALTNPEIIQPKFLRLVKAVSIPDEDILDFDNAIFGVSANQLMREIVGYVPIEPDGSVRAVVPANVPLMIDIVNSEGKRINIENPTASVRHENWLHLAPGATLSCRGCHASGSTEPHGRLDAQAPSVHGGAPQATLPFPNTDPLLFSPNGGETMAEIYTFHNGIEARTPSIDLVYDDVWTDDSGVLSKANSFIVTYENLNTPAPTSTGIGGCTESWSEICRITINYPDHIQPLWEAIRSPVDDGSGNMVDSCIGCHNANGRIPAGQLDLTSTPSDIEMTHMTSYHELLEADGELVDDGGSIGERLWECNVLDNRGDPVPDGMGGYQRTAVAATALFPQLAQVPPSMSITGANFGNSQFFFNCMTQDNLANEPNDQICRSFTGQAIPAQFVNFPNECIDLGNNVGNEAVVNHNGMLLPVELRMIAEWLDIGGQYYNNPFDAPPP